MSDREALAAAFYRMGQRELAPFDEDLLTVAGAVKERLAQLPEKCGTCDGSGKRPGGYVNIACPTCHGSGKVYPADALTDFETDQLIQELVRRGEWPHGIPATPISTSKPPWIIEEPS